MEPTSLLTPRAKKSEIASDEVETAAQRERLSLRIVTAADKEQPNYRDLLAEILKVQKVLAWRPGMTAREVAKGFLGTTWSQSELHALIAEGGWLTVAIDRETGQLQGYGLVSLIRHLPPGDFVPAPDSPLRTRDEILDDARFMYGYQIAVRPDRSLRRLSIGPAIFAAGQTEGCRRCINVVACAMEAPWCNKSSLAFLTAMRRKRIGTIYDPAGPPLIAQPVVWACLVTWPLRELNSSPETWTQPGLKAQS